MKTRFGSTRVPRWSDAFRRSGLILVAAAIGFGCAISSTWADPSVGDQGPAQAASDLWWTYQIAGRRVGYLHETTTGKASGAIMTDADAVIALGALGSKVEIKMKIASEEMADGALRSVRCQTSSSTQTTMMEAVVTEGKVRVRSRSGAKTYERDISYQGRLLGPAGVRRLAAHALQGPGEAIEYRMFVPELEDVRKITRQVVAIEDVDLPSGHFRSIKATEQIEGYPARRTIWLDREGRLIRHQETGPFGLTEVVRSDRATAEGTAAGGELPSDFFERALVRSNVRLPSPRTISRLVLRLTQKNPQAGWPAFDGPTQSVKARDGNSLTLEIGQVQPRSAAAGSTLAVGAMAEYLAPNPLIQCDDPEVQRICRELAGDARKDPLHAARQLASWVQTNMTFDPGMVVVPASEVVRKRRGTCMAYAVLLATLARAAGIPSRVAIGYVYVAGVWGGHAWVEVMVEDRWVPLDAALPGPGACDAARICCIRSSLAKGLGAELGPLMQLFGNLDVSVVEYDQDAVRTKVPGNAKSHVIDGDVYRNVWLGITLRKPPGFKFLKLDAIYPDRAVLGLQGPSRELVELRQLDLGTSGDARAACAVRLRVLVPNGVESEVSMSGRNAMAVSDGKKAACAVVEKTDVWVLTVEAENAAALLRDLAAGLKLGAAGPNDTGAKRSPSFR